MPLSARPHPITTYDKTTNIYVLVTFYTDTSPMNDEFVGMTEYIVESFHDLLTRDSESPSDSDSSRGSHHLSQECFMAGTPEGHVKSIHEVGATPPTDLDDEVEGDTGTPPRL